MPRMRRTWAMMAATGFAVVLATHAASPVPGNPSIHTTTNQTNLTTTPPFTTSTPPPDTTPAPTTEPPSTPVPTTSAPTTSLAPPSTSTPPSSPPPTSRPTTTAAPTPPPTSSAPPTTAMPTTTSAPPTTTQTMVTTEPPTPIDEVNEPADDTPPTAVPATTAPATIATVSKPPHLAPLHAESATTSSDSENYAQLIAIACFAAVGAGIVIMMAVYVWRNHRSRRAKAGLSSFSTSNPSDRSDPMLPAEVAHDVELSVCVDDSVFMYDLPTPKEDIALTSPSSIATTPKRFSAVDEADEMRASSSFGRGTSYSSPASPPAMSPPPSSFLTLPRWAGVMYFGAQSKDVVRAPSSTSRQTYPHAALKKSGSITDAASNDLIRLDFAAISTPQTSVFRAIQGDSAMPTDTMLRDIASASRDDADSTSSSDGGCNSEWSLIL